MSQDGGRCRTVSQPKLPRTSSSTRTTPSTGDSLGGRRCPRARAGQADPAVDRLFRVPLVPRDGARVVRGPGSGGGDEPPFINIKVDREERPDLDQIYQTAHQMLASARAAGRSRCSSRPTARRFSAARTSPKTPRYGMPGFGDLLPKIAAAYREQAREIAKQNEALVDALERTVPARRAAPLALDARAARRRRARARAGVRRRARRHRSGAEVSASLRARSSACAATRSKAARSQARS